MDALRFGGIGKRGIVAFVFAVLVGLSGAASVVAQSNASSLATPTAPAAIGSPTVVVSGSGSASGAANGAIIQLLVRQLGVADVSDPSAASAGPASPTKEQIKKVVDALIGAGVAKDGTMSSITPDGPYYGTFGKGLAVIVFQLNANQIKKTTKFVQVALKTGEEAGVAFDSVNSVYTTADCASVANAALTAAIADAHAQAEAMAPALGFTLGGLVQAVSQSSYGKSYAGGGGGGANYCSQPWTLESAATSYLSTFDPNAEREVEIYANVSLTYALI